MISTRAILNEIWLTDSGQVGGSLTGAEGLRLTAGQYLLAHRPEGLEPLPAALFPTAGGTAGLLRLAPPLPSGWSPGMRLVVRGPLGHGFKLPPSARRVALAAPFGAPHRLLPLIAPALAQGAVVTLLAEELPRGLPAAVEALPLESLGEAPAWADYLALDVPRAMLNRLPTLADGLGRLCPTQVLVAGPLACGGMAECGVCAVPGRGGALLACKEGPVFDFDRLELR